MKNFVKLIYVTVLIACIVGCAALFGGKKTAVERKIANFDYTPAVSEAPGSSRVVLVLMQPRFSQEFVLNRYNDIQILRDFSTAMAADFEQVITSRGYTYRGPYKDIGNVVYSDKRDADMFLEVEIDMNIDKTLVISTPQYYYVKRKPILSGYRFTGNLVFKGKVNVYLTETTRNERLSVKSISLDHKKVPIDHVSANEEFNFYDVLGLSALGAIVPEADSQPNQPGLALLAEIRGPNSPFREGVSATNSQILAYNGFVTALEDYYKLILSTTYAHLDPAELQSLKLQVLEIRERAAR
jgi:hypothetical protein